MTMILDFLAHLLDTESFPPRWLCGTGWQPFTGWFMISSDLLIFSAYVSIPLLLLYFINKKKDMVFPRIFWLFALFIFACGVSHLLDAVMFWWPAYRVNALERFVTGIVSWATVFALIPIVPIALSLKSPAALEKEVEERRRVEAELRNLNMNLERIVDERTRALNEKAWELQATNQELEAFSYSISHDLKAPLRKIEQFSELIQIQHGEQISEQAREYLDRIEANTTQMRELIDDLLSFSRYTRAELKREPLDLSRIVTEILADMHLQEPERDVESIVAPGVQAMGDPSLLRAVLENLLTNAWKYTSRTEKARIEFGQTPRGAYYLKDNGVGFEMKAADRLFKPFQRLHHKTEFPGSGIGLANVQRIIVRHGGRVWAEGEPEKGAIFYFSLPDAETSHFSLVEEHSLS